MIQRSVALLVVLCVIGALSDTPKTFSQIKAKVQPVISPDNSLSQIVQLINKASVTLDIQQRWIQKFGRSSWASDPSPLVPAVIKAFNRGVKIRILLQSSVDKHDALSFFSSIGIPTRYLPESRNVHNKGVIVDSKFVLVSSINWSYGSLVNNRETGVIIENNDVVAFFQSAFDADWSISPEIPLGKQKVDITSVPSISESRSYKIIEGVMDITCFTNPDQANEFVMNQFTNIYHSFHGEMYSSTAPSLTNRLIKTYQRSRSITDMTIIFSATRSEDDTTLEQEQSLSNGGIEILLSNSKFALQHAKFWIIDGVRVTIFSGNWAKTSLTSLDDLQNGKIPNREWGVEFSSEQVASVFESLFQEDLAIASPYAPTPN